MKTVMKMLVIVMMMVTVTMMMMVLVSVMVMMVMMIGLNTSASGKVVWCTFGGRQTQKKTESKSVKIFTLVTQTKKSKNINKEY